MTGLSPDIHRYIIAALFMLTGLLHFIRPQVFVNIMPDYIPYHLAMVYISGIAEILGGIGVLVSQTQNLAGWGLVLLLIAVFPANINMTVDAIQEQGVKSWWTIATLLRLPLQFVLIYWVYWACIK
jgi:uncharacterized membrane protein